VFKAFADHNGTSTNVPVLIYSLLNTTDLPEELKNRGRKNDDHGTWRLFYGIPSDSH